MPSPALDLALLAALAAALVPACRGCGSQPVPVAGTGSGSSISAAQAGPEPPLPGVDTPSAALAAALQACLAAQGPGYPPRTRHLRPDGGPLYTNRLICEHSPYLLQHAHNPVDWYPWGDEAFERARQRGVPVFLSIGYSTCHWCHVMERESFEDEDIAAYLNAHFVAVEVDREERPDVDDVYMTAVTAMTGSGGWPLTVFLTPDRRPFYGGTYFPPHGQAGRPGLLQVLAAVSQAYQTDRAEVQADANRLSQLVARAVRPDRPGDVPGPEAIQTAVEQLAASFDPVNGGFGSGAKFPRPAVLELLLRYARRTGDAAARHMVVLTLERMAAGGIHDQVGGGFHRYATDPAWLVPHFEKMLYDNAQLAVAYVEAWQLTGRDDLAEVARQTLDWVRRDMTNPAGGFYSATDADSPGPDGEPAEGWFFTWSEAELDAALGPDDGRIARGYWGTTPAGDFHGRNILHAAGSAEAVAAGLGMDADAVRQAIERARPELLRARDRRPRPHLDDKVLTAWNGLMISAFARAALAFDDASDLEAAQRAADFVLANLRLDDGRLLRAWRDGRAEQPAFLDDYADLIGGLLDLYQADHDPRWLRQAVDLQAAQDASFWDDAQGGYFATAADAEPLLARARPDEDEAEPSGNAVALMNLLRLGALTLDDAYQARAQRLLGAFATTLTERGTAAPFMLAGLDFSLDAAREIAIVLPAAGGDPEPLLAVVRRRFLPNAVLMVAREDDIAALTATLPALEDKVAQDGRPTAYVCERGRCQEPTTDPEVLASQLDAVPPLFADPAERRPLTVLGAREGTSQPAP